MKRAFTLLEILGALAIMAIIAAVTLPGINQRLIETKIAEEDARLDAIKAELLRSLDSDDFDQVNIAALAGEVPTAAVLTTFSTSTAATYTATATGDWFAKIARLRGASVTGSAPTRSAQPAVADVLLNSFDRPRMLFVGPSETGKQRFLLVSLVSRTEQLVMPAYENTAAWFNAIWDHEWNTTSGGLPSYWTSNSRLSAAQITAWGGSAAGTMTNRLRVMKITVPRYKLTISNTHVSTNGYVYYNGSSNVITADAGTGVTVSPEILAGRTIRVLKGSTLASASEMSRFQLRQNTDILIQ